MSNRPRSPRRVLRGETLLTPRVPTDLRAAWGEAIEEQYGWPVDPVEYADGELEAWDEWVHTQLEDGLWTEIDAYDAYDAYDDRFDGPADAYYDDYYFCRDDAYYFNEDDTWDDHSTPWWRVADQTDDAWDVHNGVTGTAGPVPTTRTPVPPHWDPTHPLYGMHPRKDPGNPRNLKGKR